MDLASPIGFRCALCATVLQQRLVDLAKAALWAIPRERERRPLLALYHRRRNADRKNARPPAVAAQPDTLRSTCPSCGKEILRNDRLRALSHEEPLCAFWSSTVVSAGGGDRTDTREVREPDNEWAVEVLGDLAEFFAPPKGPPS